MTLAKSNASDFVVVGAGVFGLAVARSLLVRDPAFKVLILEKEAETGRHTSGRNSGVLHQGIYYPPASLKAKFCIAGSRLIEEFCIDKKVPLNRIGKVILPLKDSDDAQLDFLWRRARDNGADIQSIHQSELRELEPAALSLTGRALYSPRTAVIDPLVTLKALEADVISRRAVIRFNAEVKDLDAAKKIIRLPQETISYGHLINASGLHADKVAHACGIAKKYTLLPFRGIYAKLKTESSLKIQRLIYPVPDLNVPFLGVHFTPSVSGDVYVGPTALPALGREHYHGLKGIDWSSVPRLLKFLGTSYWRNKQGFRAYAHQEMGHLFKATLAAEARQMVPAVRTSDIKSSPKVGIRAQLYNLEAQELVMDFLIERGENSTHILNAVSPGWTSALSFADYVTADLCEKSAVA